MCLCSLEQTINFCNVFVMSCGGCVFLWRGNLDLVRYLVERAHCDVSELLLQYKYLKQLNVLM